MQNDRQLSDAGEGARCPSACTCRTCARPPGRASGGVVFSFAHHGEST